MSTDLTTQTGFSKIEQVLIGGDLSKLSESDRVMYYKNVCTSVGLNPLTKPFDYITLNGKLTLYARKDATDQLRTLHKVSIKIVDKQKIDDVYIVTAEAKNAEGREDSSTGAVSVARLTGDHLANAMMKAETKAKRRVTLSICGLGLLDETEVETIPSKDKSGVYPSQPEEGDGDTTPMEWKFSFGKFDNRTVEEVYNEPKWGPKALSGYVDYLETSALKSGKPLSQKALEAISHIERFLGVMENREPGEEE